MKSIDIFKKDIEVYLEDSYQDRDVTKHPLFGVEKNDIYLLKFNLPELLLIYDLNENDFKTINIPLYPNYGVIGDFIKKVKTFERKIKHMIKKKNPDLKFVSNVHNKEGEKRYLRCKFNDELIKQSSSLDEINLSDFKKDGSIKGSIKLPFVWIHDGKFGVYYLLSIIRYESNKNIYIDSDDEEDLISKNINVRQITKPPLMKKKGPSMSSNGSNLNTPMPASKSGPFCPSANELLNMRKKLNKIAEN